LGIHPAAELRKACDAGFAGDLHVSASGGAWKFNGHMLGFDDVHSLAVKLPEFPLQERTFKSTEIRIMGEESKFTLTGGSITVRPDQNRVTLRLQESGRPFAGNGDYPLNVSLSAPTCDKSGAGSP
jgi:hypothetical protein